VERRIEREKEGKKKREEKEEWKGTSREDRVGWAKKTARGHYMISLQCTFDGPCTFIMPALKFA